MSTTRADWEITVHLPEGFSLIIDRNQDVAVYRGGPASRLLALHNSGLQLGDEDALKLIRAYKTIAEAIIKELTKEDTKDA